MLQESADYFLKFGNIGLEHFTVLGRPNPRTGFKGFADYADSARCRSALP
jgi:hypothetical protein